MKIGVADTAGIAATRTEVSVRPVLSMQQIVFVNDLWILFSAFYAFIGSIKLDLMNLT